MKSKKPPHQQTQKTAQKTDWSNVAEWYDRLVGDAGSEYHQHVVLPGVMRLLEPKPKQRIVDVACGQGVLCRLLRERGAEVTGIDAAEPLIKAARERGPADIRYQVGDARELSMLASSAFDAAACVLAIQNIHPIQPLFDGVARALRDGGRFVIVMMHPAFRGPKETSWGWDDAKKAQYRRVDRYLIPRKSPIVAHPGAAPDVYTWTFHKPIEAYVKASRNAGLLIDVLEEWPSHKTSDSGPRAHAENVARKEIPMFLAIRAISIGSLSPYSGYRLGEVLIDETSPAREYAQTPHPRPLPGYGAREYVSLPMSDQPPTINYRNPGTGDGSADPIVARMMQRHALTSAGAIGLLAGGVAILFFAGAVVSSIICFILIAITDSSWIGWWGWYLVFLVAMVPLLFWEERRSRGTYLDDRVTGFSASPSSRGEFEVQKFEATTAVVTDMLLWGPRAILKGFATLRGERSPDHFDRFARASLIVRKLLEHDSALLAGQLLEPGEKVDDIRGTLRWLDDHDYIGMSGNGQRVWLSSDARKWMTDLK